MQTYSNPVELQIRAIHVPNTPKPSFWKRVFGKEVPPPSQYAVSLTPLDNENMVFPIIIGNYEAQAMAVVLEDMAPGRPLQSDLLKAAAEQFGYTLEYSIIHKIDQKGIYHAAIHYTNGEKQVVLDARPSDAITAALQTKKPILIEKELLEKYCLGANP
jgi:bifunctional DNase/RNase